MCKSSLSSSHSLFVCTYLSFFVGNAGIFQEALFFGSDAISSFVCPFVWSIKVYLLLLSQYWNWFCGRTAALLWCGHATAKQCYCNDLRARCSAQRTQIKNEIIIIIVNLLNQYSCDVCTLKFTSLGYFVKSRAAAAAVYRVCIYCTYVKYILFYCMRGASAVR